MPTIKPISPYSHPAARRGAGGVSTPMNRGTVSLPASSPTSSYVDLMTPGAPSAMSPSAMSPADYAIAQEKPGAWDITKNIAKGVVTGQARGAAQNAILNKLADLEAKGYFAGSGNTGPGANVPMAETMSEAVSITSPGKVVGAPGAGEGVSAPTSVSAPDMYSGYADLNASAGNLPPITNIGNGIGITRDGMAINLKSAAPDVSNWIKGPAAIAGGITGSYIGSSVMPNDYSSQAMGRNAGRAIGVGTALAPFGPQVAVPAAMVAAASEAVPKVIGDAAEQVRTDLIPAVTDWVSSVGHGVGQLFGLSCCILFSRFYGKDSEEVRNAKQYVQEGNIGYTTLIGYYQMGRMIVSLCKRFPKIKPFLKKHLVFHFAEHVRGKIAQHQTTWTNEAVSAVYLRVCFVVAYSKIALGIKLYIPHDAGQCLLDAARTSMDVMKEVV